MPDPFAEDQTLLGFDFGLRYIGVAVGQTVTQTATPLTRLKARDGTPKWDQIDMLIHTWHPNALVVGLPDDGTTDRLANIMEATQRFIQKLKTRYALPIHAIDEKLSTKEARAQLFEEGGYKKLSRDYLDSYAAKLILETWLNKNCG